MIWLPQNEWFSYHVTGEKHHAKYKTALFDNTAKRNCYSSAQNEMIFAWNAFCITSYHKCTTPLRIISTMNGEHTEQSSKGRLMAAMAIHR